MFLRISVQSSSRGRRLVQTRKTYFGRSPDSLGKVGCSPLEFLETALQAGETEKREVYRNGLRFFQVVLCRILREAGIKEPPSEQAPCSSTELPHKFRLFLFKLSAESRAAEEPNGLDKQEAPWLFAESLRDHDIFPFFLCRKQSSGRDEWTRQTRGTLHRTYVI
jgi:hypothetical protein